MTIETKYNIGDEVWFIDQDELLYNAYVCYIGIYCFAKKPVDIQYQVTANPRKIFVGEQYLYSSEEDAVRAGNPVQNEF